MARVEDIVSTVLMNMLGVILAAALIWGGHRLIALIPSLESWLLPVIKIEPVRDQDTYRDRQKACFSLRLTKLLSGPPADYQFFGDTTNKTGGIVVSPELPLSTYTALESHERDTRAWTNHDVGQTWTRIWCFELPGTVADWQTITITGSAYHHRHWLYDSVTPIPPFTIPALKKDPAP